MADIELYETLEGGDFLLKGNDLSVIDGWQNMVYLALFGGNVEQSTQQFNEDEQRFDWWGNDTFYQDRPKPQFNSNTERLLNQTPVSSAGLEKIRQGVVSDLAFMIEFAEIEVSVSAISDDRIRIDISVNEPNNLQSNEFTYIWDATESELYNGTDLLLNNNPSLVPLNAKKTEIGEVKITEQGIIKTTE